MAKKCCLKKHIPKLILIEDSSLLIQINKKIIVLNPFKIRFEKINVLNYR